MGLGLRPHSYAERFHWKRIELQTLLKVDGDENSYISY